MQNFKTESGEKSHIDSLAASSLFMRFAMLRDAGVKLCGNCDHSGKSVTMKNMGLKQVEE